MFPILYSLIQNKEKDTSPTNLATFNYQHQIKKSSMENRARERYVSRRAAISETFKVPARVARVEQHRHFNDFQTMVERNFLRARYEKLEWILRAVHLNMACT
jgi:hypothetical protein